MTEVSTLQQELQSDSRRKQTHDAATFRSLEVIYRRQVEGKVTPHLEILQIHTFFSVEKAFSDLQATSYATHTGGHLGLDFPRRT